MTTSTAVTRSTSAAHDLRNAEDNAVNGNSDDSSFSYTGNGKDRNQKATLKGRLKKRIALVVIIACLGGGGAFLGSSNSLLAPALESRITTVTDGQYASSQARAARLMRFYLGDTGATSTTWTGAKKYTKMSNAFQERLALNGITVDGSGSSKTLVFSQDVVDADGITTTQKTIIPADDFDKVYSDNTKFREAYSSAKRGRLANFFDNIAYKIYNYFGISRNSFKDFVSTGDPEVDQANYKNLVSEKFNGNESKMTSTKIYDSEEDVLDEDGHPVIDEATGEPKKTTVHHNESESVSTRTEGSDVASARTKAKNLIDSIKGSVADKGINITCAALRVGLMISSIVAADAILKSINFFTTGMESVSKMKAGGGDESGINEFLNLLTTPTTASVTNLADVKDMGSDAGNDIEITGSPIEANGLQNMLAGAALVTTTTKLYSQERVATSVFSGLKKYDNNITNTCAINDISSSALSLISIGVSFAGGIASMVGNLIISSAISIVVSVGVATFLSFLIPTIATALFTNFFETVTGIPMGEAFASGAYASNSRIFRNGSGGSGGSEDAAKSYLALTNSVLALDAEVDRETLSPFDYTNQNTFFGNIAYKILPLLTKTSLTGSISTFSNIASTSIASLLPSAYADDGTDPTNTYTTTFGECPMLEKANMVGDIYCNPIITMDTSTINISPTDSKYQEVMSEVMECDDDGNCTIIKDSDLAYYISFCAGRDSPFGNVDQNILGSLQPSSGLGSIGGAIVNGIPVVGDIVSIVDGKADLKNVGWATGEKCSNSSANSDWDTFKYYQRYIEDTRLLDQQGAFDDSKNPILAYLEEYETEHPIDYSYEGMLARFSGYTKENVETAIAFVEYYLYLDEYDPSSRLAMDGTSGQPTTSADIKSSIQQKPNIQFEIPENIPQNSAFIAIIYRCDYYSPQVTLRDKNYIV